MRNLDTLSLKSRVKGKAALVRSLRSLELRVMRFGMLRARQDTDRRWAVDVATRLRAIIAECL